MLCKLAALTLGLWEKRSTLIWLLSSSAACNHVCKRMPCQYCAAEFDHFLKARQVSKILIIQQQAHLTFSPAAHSPVLHCTAGVPEPEEEWSRSARAVWF